VKGTRTSWHIATSLILFASAACSSSQNGVAPLPNQLTASAGAVQPALDGATGLPGGEAPCAPVTGQMNCSIVLNTEIPPISNPLTPASLLPGLHPADLQAAYALPIQRAGTLIAVVDAYDSPTAQVDLAVYRAAFGLPPCTSATGCFKKVNQSGTTGTFPSLNTQWDEEIALDLDMVSAACPQCRILLVEANSASLADLATGVDRAVSLGAKVVSNSYYANEWSGEESMDVHYHHPGVAITASSGDSSLPSYPAASQYVTAVGGTSLTESSNALVKTWTETMWQYDGHGCSAYVARPSWQTANACATRRSVVDMAVVADPKTGVSMFDSLAGGWLVAGGTSVGAALIAGAYGVSGNFAGPAYSYAHPEAFHDIAPAGFDLVTGLGSPNGVGAL